jgi:antitoxin (DNA-binding transcriptional repressor) of toxin-antitoxin stability system
VKVNASLRELNSASSALARRAQAGETIVITDRGVPIADLVPHQRDRRPAMRSAVLDAFGRLASDDHERFRGQLDELIDPSLHPTA